MDLLFEYRNCPSCGQNDFEVLFESNMRDCDFQEVVETVYMIPGGKYGRHVKCRNCHLIYVNPIEKASKINQAYSQRKDGDAPIIRETRLTATESQLGLIKRYGNGTRLLDVGCGEGFFLFNASKAGYTTKGIEISQDVAEYARSEFGLDVEAKPFEELRFPENYFDVITLWQVLEHVPYPLMVLKEVKRILKPGGLLATSTPDIEGILAKIFRRKWWNLRRLHINQFTAKTLADMLNRAGFKNVFSTDYRESISISMLVIPVLKHLRMYERAKDLFYPSCTSGKIMNKLTLAYSSKLDNCTVIGFK
ncbi:MAG TPA: class I SAM-dependent methyltransferase [Dehalococcoidia bacterium]|nr:class I SAM-dependent methyltransferase [Dehalococcoidia bacterium]